jgi:hypothetical protein
VFPNLIEMHCGTEKVITGTKPTNAMINFGGKNEIKFMAIDSFLDSKF